MVLLGVRRILQEGGHVESEIFFFFLMKLRLMRKWLTWQVRHSLLIGVPYPFLYYY